LGAAENCGSGSGLGYARAAQGGDLPVHRFAKLSDPEAQQALTGLNAELGVMAYVIQFAPPQFCAIPKHGMIQFHPSLLPAHRGAASLGWAIISGRTETGRAQRRPFSALIVAEIACAVVLTVCAGLLVRSFARVRSVDPGFQPAKVLTANLRPNYYVPEGLAFWRAVPDG